MIASDNKHYLVHYLAAVVMPTLLELNCTHFHANHHYQPSRTNELTSELTNSVVVGIANKTARHFPERGQLLHR